MKNERVPAFRDFHDGYSVFLAQAQVLERRMKGKGNDPGPYLPGFVSQPTQFGIPRTLQWDPSWMMCFLKFALMCRFSREAARGVGGDFPAPVAGRAQQTNYPSGGDFSAIFFICGRQAPVPQKSGATLRFTHGAWPGTIGPRCCFD